MHATVEIFAAIAFGVIGLSHLFQPRAWIDFFLRLRAQGDAGAFILAILYLLPGVLLAATHNVWSGPGIILTLIGWGWVIKASLYFIAPAVARWSLSHVAHERTGAFRVAGMLLIVIAGTLMMWACRGR